MPLQSWFFRNLRANHKYKHIAKISHAISPRDTSAHASQRHRLQSSINRPADKDPWPRLKTEFQAILPLPGHPILFPQRTDAYRFVGFPDTTRDFIPTPHKHQVASLLFSLNPPPLLLASRAVQTNQYPVHTWNLYTFHIKNKPGSQNTVLTG